MSGKPAAARGPVAQPDRDHPASEVTKIWIAVQDDAASVDRPPEGTQAAPPSGGETEQRGQVGATLPSVHKAPLERAS